MELEELKNGWERLSRRLERQEVLRREDLKRVLAERMGSYLQYVRFMALLSVVAIPLCVAIGKWRGLDDRFIAIVMTCYAVALLPWGWALRELQRLARCEGDIVGQARRMSRYVRFMRGYYLICNAVVILFLAGFLVRFARYYSEHGMWWQVAGIVALGCVVVAAAERHEFARIRELQRRLRELEDE